MEKYEVGIIGAGPAGMMAAITAAKNGKKVILFEKNKTPGLKLLATGNGRCNLTNKNITLDRYHGADESFVGETLTKFSSADTIKFFESFGVAVKEEDRGRIFPCSDQSATVLAALKKTLAESGVKVQTETIVKSVKKEANFVITTEDGEAFEVEKLIIATGGKASFHLGSSGDGIFWARKFGHNIVPIYAALVPIETNEDWVQEMQGVKLQMKVSTTLDGEVLRQSRGDVLFTHFGISGPGAMAQAGMIAPFAGKKEIIIHLDLLPDISAKELDTKIERLFKEMPKKKVINVLTEILPEKVAKVILHLSGIQDRKNVSEISKADRQRLVKQIKNLELTAKGVRPLKEAQVSRGGVDTKEVNPNTLESKLVPGLYLAGEVLDVDADSGGFNLQWAWASGSIAGQTL